MIRLSDPSCIFTHSNVEGGYRSILWATCTSLAHSDRLVLRLGEIVMTRDMKNKLSKRHPVDVVLRVPSGHRGIWGSCLIHLHPEPRSRVVEISRTSLRIAFTADEIRIVARAIRRVHPRPHFELPVLAMGQNRNYIPGSNSRPFSVALATDNAVKIGLEIAHGVRHPVVELTALPNSRVRRSSWGWTWMPRWTEIRALVAQCALVSSWTSRRRFTPHSVLTK